MSSRLKELHKKFRRRGLPRGEFEELQDLVFEEVWGDSAERYREEIPMPAPRPVARWNGEELVNPALFRF